MKLTWMPRLIPLRPEAAIATGAAAQKISQLMLRYPVERLERLKAGGLGELLLVVGDEDDLPWAPGVSYLGRDPDAHQIYLPTNLQPNLPAILLEQSLRQAGKRLPLAVLPETMQLVTITNLLPLRREILEKFANDLRFEK